MAVIRYEIRQGVYADSVVLMQLQSDLARLPEILEAGVVMGTAANLELLRAHRLAPPADQEVGAEDLVIAVKADSEAAATRALEAVDSLLERRSSGEADEFRPRSLRAALRLLPDATWALISTPGRYAAALARDALAHGLNVFLYSDHVSLADEARLKSEAVADGLLVLGPDCGTAWIQGIGFGFANRVRRGSVGLVCASGTGLQAIASRVHQLGGGISQGLGTGGRDLQAEVGGLTARQALDLLGRDPATGVIVVAAKTPHAPVAAEVLAAALRTSKPVVVYFSGQPTPAPTLAGIHFARSLSEAAELAVALAAPERPTGSDEDRLPPRPFPEADPASGRGWIRGLFAGGTLALEAVQGLHPFVGPLHSNTGAPGSEPLRQPTRSQGHTILDLGADEFTLGRLHPMLDPHLRLQRLRQEAADPEVAAILLDVVLGSGSHPDPATHLAPAIAELAQRDDLQIAVVVVGTDEDPQDLAATRERLAASGALVYDSVTQALDAVLRRCAPSPPPLARRVAEDLLRRPVAAINFGLESFYDDLVRQGAEALHVDWRPPAGGDENLMAVLEKMRS